MSNRSALRRFCRQGLVGLFARPVLGLCVVVIAVVAATPATAIPERWNLEFTAVGDNPPWQSDGEMLGTGWFEFDKDTTDTLCVDRDCANGWPGGTTVDVRTLITHIEISLAGVDVLIPARYIWADDTHSQGMSGCLTRGGCSIVTDFEDSWFLGDPFQGVHQLTMSSMVELREGLWGGDFGFVRASPTGHFFGTWTATQIPEPSTALLLAGGLALAMGRRRSSIR
jgi:hypothetical protein